MDTLAMIVEGLRAEGHQIELITGGGTGTVTADLEIDLLNELQPGSYVFMDAHYADALGADEDGEFLNALWVSAQVISINAEPIVTVDAGLKAFATDGPAPRTLDERFRGSTYAFFGDEHGALTRPHGPTVTHGERCELLPPHCDPTVDRYTAYHVVHGDQVVDIVPIDGVRSSQ